MENSPRLLTKMIHASTDKKFSLSEVINDDPNYLLDQAIEKNSNLRQSPTLASVRAQNELLVSILKKLSNIESVLGFKADFSSTKEKTAYEEWLACNAP